MSMVTTPVSEWSRRLVEALVANGQLTVNDGRAALERAAASGTPVAVLLARDNLVDAAATLESLAALSGLRAVDLVGSPPSPAAAAAVPLAIARRHRTVGHRLEAGYLVLACAEPLAADQLRAIASSVECGIAGCVLADPLTLERVIEETALRGAIVTKAPEPEPEFGSPTDHESIVQENVVDVAGQAPPRDDPQPEEEDPMKLLSRSALRDARTAGATSLDLTDYSVPQFDEPAEFGRSSTESRMPAWIIADPDPAPFGKAGAQSGDAPSDFHPEASDINQLLTYAVKNGASDLHLTAKFPPAVRIDGSIRPIEGLLPLEPLELRRMVFDVLPQSVRERFEATKELDTSYEIPDVGRFRLSVFLQRGAVGAVFRTIPPGVPSLDSLGLPKSLGAFADLRRGLVLVTGPTGSGKSTTLAAIVDKINANKPLHIMTVEDPIEFQHEHKRSIVNQREVGQDTTSFSECLRHVLRQDPDVILVGEMRDLETISTALTAAETGHLVFATLHTQDAPQTIDRIIDVFPTNQQDQVRVQLASALEAVVTQQLVISESGVGRVPVIEVMVCTPAIRNLIRSAKTHQIYSLMQTGESSGMQTMDQALAQAVRERKISQSVAFDRAHDPKQLLDYLKG